MPPDLCALLLTGVLTAGNVHPPSEPADMEMLEFLGAFETRDGKWLDPLSLEDRDAEQAKPMREEKLHD